MTDEFEDKARGLADDYDYGDPRDRELAVEAIASSLRSAHNDALERAAVLLEERAQYLWDHGDEYDPLIAKELRDQAARLRALKVKT